MGYLPSTCSAQNRFPTKEREGAKKIQHESSFSPKAFDTTGAHDIEASLLQLTRVVYNTKGLTMTSVHPHKVSMRNSTRETTF